MVAGGVVGDQLADHDPASRRRRCRARRARRCRSASGTGSGCRPAASRRLGSCRSRGRARRSPRLPSRRPRRTRCSSRRRGASRRPRAASRSHFGAAPAAGSRARPSPGRGCRRRGAAARPVEPSPKQGEQMSGPPKAKVSRPASAPASGEAKAPSCRHAVRRHADVLRRPAVFAAGRDVGIDARGWSGCRRPGSRRRGRRRGAVASSPAGSRRTVPGRGRGRTRRRSRRCWRPRPARRRGSRAAARRPSAGGHGRCRIRR